MGDFQQVLHTVIPSPPVEHTPSPPSQAPVVAPVIPSVAPPSNEPVMPTFVTPTRQTVILPARTTTTDSITTTTTTNVPPTGSILPTLTFQSQGIPYYIPLSYLSSLVNQDPLTVSTVNAQTINVSTLNSISTNAQTINVSTLNSISTNAHNVLTNYIEATEAYVYDKLTLDNQVLTANAVDLLLNGIPIATTNNISSIADWSFDPAISTIQANGNDLTNVRFANFSTIVANSMVVNNLTTLFSTTVETFESTITAEIHKLTVSSITGGNAFFDVLTAGSIVNPSASTINCDYLNVASNATFSGTRPNFNTGFVTSGANNFNFQNIDNASNINGNVINIAPQNNLNVNTSNAMTVTIDRFADVGGSALVNLTAKDGAGSVISLNANSAHPNALTPTSAVNINAQGNVGLLTDAPFGGAVNITAQAGLTGLGASVLGGGGINLTAYSYGILAPGTIKESAGSILAYSGLTTPSVGVIGNSYYSALNCLSLTAGATPTTTSYPGVVYLRGDSGTKVVNGFYTDTITATGSAALPTITGVTTINGSAYPPASASSWVSTATTDLNMSGLNINNVSTINFSSPGGGSGTGYIAQQYGTSGALLINDTVGIINKAPSVVLQTPTGNTNYALNDTGATITQPGSMVINSPAITLSTATITCPGNLAIKSLTTVSSINGAVYPPTVSIPSALVVSTLNVSTTTTAPIVQGTGAGYTWTQNPVSISTTWTCVTYATGFNKLFMGCASNDYIYYYNGSTLAQQATVQNWSWITSFGTSFGGFSKAGACVKGGSIWVTANTGTLWTVTTAPTSQWTGITNGDNNGTVFYAVSSDNGAWYSGDFGVTWTQLTGSTGLNWSAVCNDTNGIIYAVVNGGKLYKLNTTTATVVAASITGAWVSLAPYTHIFPANVGYPSVLVGRIDGNLNYRYNAYAGTFTSIPGAKGYIGTNYTSALIVCALPNNPITYSINGSSFFTSSSISANWTCVSTWTGSSGNNTTDEPYINVCVSPGYVYQLGGSFTEYGNLIIQSPSQVLINCGNTTSATSDTAQGVITLASGTLYVGRQVNMLSPATVAYKRQPFIQYGTATTVGASPYLVTIPYAYNGGTSSYTTIITLRDTSPTLTYCASNVNQTSFRIYWSGGGTVSLGFGWTTFGI